MYCDFFFASFERKKKPTPRCGWLNNAKRRHRKRQQTTQSCWTKKVRALPPLSGAAFADVVVEQTEQEAIVMDFRVQNHRSNLYFKVCFFLACDHRTLTPPPLQI